MGVDQRLRTSADVLDGWPALLTSLAITETPILIIAYTLSFFCCFWTFGVNSAPWVGALVWLDFVIFAMWTVTFGLVRKLASFACV